MKKLQIGVIGSAGPEEYAFEKPGLKMLVAAEVIGQELARQNCIVINGGKGGIMEAVCKGAQGTGGITVAETSGLERFSANPFVDIEVVTGDVAFRGPSQLVAMSDALICLGGGAGTLQEICVAYRMKKPIVLLVGFGGWTDRLDNQEWLDERRLIAFTRVSTPKDAVEQAISLVQCIKGNKQ